MFLEPELFTSAPQYRQERRRAPPRGAPEISAQSQEIRARFWKAKARREDCGIEPSGDAVARRRERYGQ